MIVERLEPESKKDTHFALATVFILNLTFRNGQDFVNYFFHISKDTHNRFENGSVSFIFLAIFANVVITLVFVTTDTRKLAKYNTGKFGNNFFSFLTEFLKIRIKAVIEGVGEFMVISNGVFGTKSNFVKVRIVKPEIIAAEGLIGNFDT